MDGQTAKRRELADHRASGDIDGLLTIFDTELTGLGDDAKRHFRRPLEELRQAHQGKQALYKGAKRTLISTGTAITLSLVGMLAAKSLVSGGGGWIGGAIGVQFATLGWAAVCYWRLATLTIGGQSNR